MALTKLQKRLFELSDNEYAEFQAKLTPGVDLNRIMGIRVPVLRKFAKEYLKDPESITFLKKLPHKYFDENMLHGLLISEQKDFDECIRLTDEFLPYVDNWAVCDIMSPKCFKKNKTALLVKIKEWAKSCHVYTARFGIEMLMSHFLDDDFKTDYLKIPAAVKSDEYYLNMMLAWFFATALAKQWEYAAAYIENNCLSLWVHNKTIQKAVESYRITDVQKAYLKSLRRKK